ncbi:MAG: replicative DNA helicase [Synergistaceae bacterium]|nr:replicative DNA helicase [Synergistaceae bacterium]
MAGSELLDRIQPNNLDAERAVLGAAIMDKGALLSAVEMLEAEDFYDPKHNMVFEVIKGMARKDKAVDNITFEDEMTRQGQWDRVGGPSFTAALFDAVTTVANIEHYCGIVREKSIHRALIRAGAEITRAGYAEEEESPQALSSAEKRIFDISRRGAKSSIKEIEEVVTSVFEQIQRSSQDGVPSNSVMSGFDDLDSLTGGFQPGSLNVIAARPSVGKTALALNIASYAAVFEGVPTLVFSLEMSAEQVASRMLSSIARVNMKELEKTRKFDNVQWTDLTSAASRLCNAPIFIDDSSTLSTFELRSRCRRFMSRFMNRKCLVIVDYLQMMSSDAKRTDNRNQEVADISRMLKAVAREFEIPVIALSQLNRKAEEREPGKRSVRASLANLRDSGAIEQDADIVAFLDRRSYQDIDSSDNTAELSIQKHRNGPTGKVDLVFYREFSKFESAARFKM